MSSGILVVKILKIPESKIYCAMATKQNLKLLIMHDAQSYMLAFVHRKKHSL